MTNRPLPVLAPAPGIPAAPTPEEVARDLGAELRGQVRFGDHDRLLYATDASMYQVAPIGVVVPADLDDVVRTVAYCGRHDVPILPRGGGTSLAGQTVNTAVVIDFSPCCRALVDVDDEARTARVEPGLVLDDLNTALRPRGLMFGPDVATSTHATLGGMIGNNSAGAHSVRYGRTVDHVRGLEVVTSDGERLRLDEGAAERDPRVAALTARVADVVRPLADQIDARYPKTRRRVNGYNLDLVLAQLRASTPGTYDRVNLAHLLCGSEGTLAVTLAATLGLVEAPPAVGLAIIAFAGVDEALLDVTPLLETQPAALELVDDVIIQLAERNIEYRHYVDRLPGGADGRAGAVLYVEYFGTAAEIEARFADVRRRYDADAVRTSMDTAAMGEAWKLRKAGEPLLHGQPGRRKPITFIEDTAVEPDRLPEFVSRFREIVARHGTWAAYYAHASVGCLHIRPMVCLTDPADVRAMSEIVESVTDLVVEFGGALSGEHGDGRLRSHLLERFYGPEICAGFRAIKSIFDPPEVLNPGNIVTALPMTEHLRIRPNGAVAEVPDTDTYFRYDREHGFGEAVAMCNGAGVCRKMEGGTMCPSYRATRDERHATRGRGNALRLAVTGQFGRLGAPSWNDAETLETLDLCLACKACKRECPSNVDVAKLKAEYLAQGYQARGRVPLHVRAIGNVRRFHRLAGGLPALANALVASPLTRPLVGRLLDVDARRSLPRVHRPLLRWARRRPSPAREAPAIVLLTDCFTTWQEPWIGRAAVESLEALGYRVVVRDQGCCGRSMISTGMLDEARTHVATTARTLAAMLDEHEAQAIVACEPSCLSAIHDDWRDLKAGVEPALVDRVATHTWLVEDFIELHWDEHPRRPEPTQRPEAVRLHAHCHQKALGDADASRRLLGRLAAPGATLIDAGCCGMAGAFGYGRERYDLSMAIAEIALLPDLRAHPEAVIAAPGTSCRHQIRDALGRRALHPIELLRAAIGDA